MKAEAEPGAMQPAAKEFLEPPDPGRDQEVLSEPARPCLDLRPPEW